MDISECTYSNDPVANRAVRGALLWEIIALVATIVPGPTGVMSTIRLVVGLPGLCVPWLCLAWLYARYRNQPPVRKRQALTAGIRAARRKMRAEEVVIEACGRRRDRLAREERAELAAGLRELQAIYVADGLAAARLVNANLPGFGPALKERLSAQGLGSAADVNATELLSIRGLGDARSQALLDWRNQLTLQLRRSMPVALPASRVSAIHRTFERQHKANERDANDARARAAGRAAELDRCRRQLQELPGTAFGRYVGFCLGGNRATARPAIMLLALGQAVLLACICFNSPAMARPAAAPVKLATRAATRTRTAQQGERPVFRPITPAPSATRPALPTTSATALPKSRTPKVTTRSTRTHRAPASSTPTRERNVLAPITRTHPPTETPTATATPLPATRTATPAQAKTTPPGTQTATPTVSTVPAGEFQNLVNLTSPIARGETASITVSTNTGAACSIKVYYKSGASKSKSLSPITAGADGLCTWTWKISTRTAPGNWSITVKTGSVEVKYAFVVT